MAVSLEMARAGYEAAWVIAMRAQEAHSAALDERETLSRGALEMANNTATAARRAAQVALDVYQMALYEAHIEPKKKEA